MRIPRLVVCAHISRLFKLPHMCCLKCINQDFCLNYIDCINYTIHSILSHLILTAVRLKFLSVWRAREDKGGGTAREETEVNFFSRGSGSGCVPGSLPFSQSTLPGLGQLK